MTFVAQNNPLTGKPYGSHIIIDQLAVIKEKYPLAVNALNGLSFTTRSPANQIETIIKSNRLEVLLMLSTVTDQAKQDQIGEMLADILNLIAKP